MKKVAIGISIVVCIVVVIVLIWYFNITKSCPSNCSGNGKCTDGKCKCYTGFSGNDCSGNESCPSNCSGNRTCTDGICKCNSGFSGEDCLTKSCPSNCSGNRTCTDGICKCNSGFSGEDCLTKSCPSNCHGIGKCLGDGTCDCPSILIPYQTGKPVPISGVNSGWIGNECKAYKYGSGYKPNKLWSENNYKPRTQINGLNYQDMLDSMQYYPEIHTLIIYSKGTGNVLALLYEAPVELKDIEIDSEFTGELFSFF